MDAIERLETTVYGDPSHQQKGLFERVNAHEEFIKRWDLRFEKIFIAIVCGALGAVGSLVLLIKILIELQPK